MTPRGNKFSDFRRLRQGKRFLALLSLFITIVWTPTAHAEVSLLVDRTRGLKSAEAAIASVEHLRRDPKHALEPITIVLSAGTYFLREPLTIPADAGPLTITAPAGQTVVLSGGSEIDDWRISSFKGHQCWAADIPAVRLGMWNFRELWVNGKRAKRARYPARGYLSAAIPDRKDVPWNQGQNWFGYKPGDAPDALPIDAEAIVLNRWVESRLSMLTVDPVRHVIHSQRITPFQLQDGDLYWLEGAPQWLTEPGDWYLDRRVGTLYYIPKPGEELHDIKAVAPRLSTVIEIKGAQDVTFSRITFSHTEWNLPDPTLTIPHPVGGFGQAAVGVPGAVILQTTGNCRFDHCIFEHIGNCGLELGRGCQGNRVEYCLFTDLGAGGIKIGDRDQQTLPADRSFGNVVSDCRITDGGHMFPSACGIWVGESYDNHIEHNEIADLYYTGISMGWSWGYGSSLCRGNHVEGNLVHHLGKKTTGDGPILSDMGAIYTLGVQPGTIISGNVFHDIVARVYGGWGIYLDEGSSGITIENNLVYRTTHGGFHQHFGRDNVVQNNIFAFGRDLQIARTKAEPTRSFTFARNIVYWNCGVFTETSPEGMTFDGNLYYCAGSGKLTFGGRSWKQWQAAGMDGHSILGDPGFMDLNQDNFTPSPAAAAKIRFEPLDVQQAGPRSK